MEPEARTQLMLRIESGGTLCLAILCSLLAFIGVLRKPSRMEKAVYEDEDGRSTPEEMAKFSNRLPKILVLVFAILGFSSSIWISVLDAKSNRNATEFVLDSWLYTGVWLLLGFNAICLLSTTRSTWAFQIGIFMFLSVIFLIIATMHRESVQTNLGSGLSMNLILRAVSLASAFGLAIWAVSLPRRPAIFDFGQGSPIDGYGTVTALQCFTFAWAFPVMRDVSKNDGMTLDKYPVLSHGSRSAGIENIWKAQHLEATPVWRALLYVFRWPIAAQCFMSACAGITVFVPRWWTLKFLESIEDGRTGEQKCFILVALVVSDLANSMLGHWIDWSRFQRISVPIRSLLCTLIFNKAMQRNDGTTSATCEDANGLQTADEPTETTPLMAKDKTVSTTGERGKTDEEKKNPRGTDSGHSIMNLFAIDAPRVSTLPAFLEILKCTLQLIASFIFLIHLLGLVPILASLLVYIFMLPLKVHFTKAYARAKGRMMEMRDQKLKAVRECLNSLRQIRISALENLWECKILDIRKCELGALWSVMVGDTALFGCSIAVTNLQAAVALSSCAAIHGNITPSVAFVGISIFKSLEVSLKTIQEITVDITDVWISYRRIEKFLEKPEATSIVSEGPNVAFDNAVIAWPIDNAKTLGADRFLLRGLNLEFPLGELSVVSGKTGSGKSLILSALVDGADLLDGKVTAPLAPSWLGRRDDKATRGNWILAGAVAYVAQTPWIENASVKTNILFGLPLDEDRYKQTIEACALERDLSNLQDGDQTELGPNGINFSGGQKCRVSLARAIYSRAAILLLDDIFSAVDASVARYIFEQCLMGELCKGRTRILATHHVALCCPRAKYLVELGGDGTVLRAELVNFEPTKSHGQSGFGHGYRSAVASESTVDRSGAGGNGRGELPAMEPARFVKDEDCERGAVKLAVYAAYFHASGGYWAWVFACAIFVFTSALFMMQRLWLKIWIDQYEDSELARAAHFGSTIDVLGLARTAMSSLIFVADGRGTAARSSGFSSTSTNPNQNDQVFYIVIFVTISATTAAFGIFRVAYLYSISFKASESLFRAMTHVVLRLPLRSLDTTPAGRFLNRFAADFNAVDSDLGHSVMMMMSVLLSLLSTCIAASFGSPLILLPATLLLVVAAGIGNIYLKGARLSKRIESMAKSPIFDLFESARQGLSTIRGYDKVPLYLARMRARIDDYTRATYHTRLFKRWMGFWMTVLGVSFTGCTGVVALMSGIPAGLAGFAMSYAMEFSSSILYTVRTYTAVEVDMNALERVVEYTKLEMEDQVGEQPPEAWPTKGCLEVKSIVAGYADDLSAVLHAVSFDVGGGESVGVVGRTGAGKSSLSLALFRLIELRSGSISIDGIDISTLDLRELRSRMAIIPQDPVLFSGTVRSNLDPCGNRTDSELEDCLRRVRLLDSNATNQDRATASGALTPTGKAQLSDTNIFRDLESAIAEGGSNLSHGQRQLLCLARVMAVRPKIIVLDEATSAVDMHMDALVQRTIREEFGGCTLIVIAHRISTIADFNRILVLSDGRVEEFGTPRDLWNRGGTFRSMCGQSGEEAKLRSIICCRKENGVELGP